MVQHRAAHKKLTNRYSALSFSIQSADFQMDCSRENIVVDY